jgi:hypothetical protein
MLSRPTGIGKATMTLPGAVDPAQRAGVAKARLACTGAEGLAKVFKPIGAALPSAFMCVAGLP